MLRCAVLCCAVQVEEDPTGGKYAQQAGQLGGAPNRLETVINFHVSPASVRV